MKTVSRRGLFEAFMPGKERVSASDGERGEPDQDYRPVPLSTGSEKISRRDLFGALGFGRKDVPFFDGVCQEPEKDCHMAPIFTGMTRETVERCDSCHRGCSFIVTIREGRLVSVGPDPDGAQREEGNITSRCEDFMSRITKKEWPV